MPLRGCTISFYRWKLSTILNYILFFYIFVYILNKITNILFVFSVKRDRIFREKSFLFNLLPLAEEFKWAHLYRYLILNGFEKKEQTKIRVI